MERVFLKLYLAGYMDVNPKEGVATLERYITQLGILRTKNNKPLSFNTIKEEISELLKEIKLQNPTFQINKFNK